MADSNLSLPLGHADMAAALVKAFGDKILWVPDLRKGEFALFEGRWRNGPEVHTEVIELLGRAIVEQARVMSLSTRAYTAMTSSGYRRDVIRTLIELNAEKLHVSLDRWDLEPAALQTPSGVFDLEAAPGTGGLPADARHRSLHCTGVAVDRTMGCPQFLGVLDNMFATSPQDLAFFKDRLGGALFGHNGDQKFNWMIGPSGGGKTTAMMAVVLVLGSYALVGNAGLVVRPARSFNTGMQAEGFHKAALARAWMVLLDEAAASGTLIAPVFKQLANGGLMQVEQKRQDPRMSRSRASCFLLTNKIVEGGLDGEEGRSLRRRIAMICADGTPPAVLVDGLAEKIMAEEGPGLLWWLIEQAREWHARRGLFGGGPIEMSSHARETVEGFTEEGDPEIEWLAECVSHTGNMADEVRSSDLWEDFARWWAAISQKGSTKSPHPPITPVNFYNSVRREVKRVGKATKCKFTDQTGKQVRGYRGMQLKSD